ncbi:MAG: zf-HC2 domain-containing protein [Melioribacteraceae bacterium]|nr:zf-HC2 domain-containing protein [Melioribacteraceae bacterium]MCF8353381.1 zf-HC2 domain-containing protein [Melioribacteraceae bacterium]MCF8393040.1 zf-HC2 domain-containing protein [Melioribacteraceae bacterium]MCF8419107.1 zf-HC2 domain-containing protein [Melioribacteraceae bacterium]
MSDCKNYQSKIQKALYNELPENDRKLLNKHLETCTECRTEFIELEEMLTVINQRESVEPDEEFMNTFWEKLEPRIIITHNNSYAWWNRIKEIITINSNWTYQLAGALTLIIIGVIIGRFLFSNNDAVINDLKNGKRINIQPASLESRTENYIERSKVLLLGLANFDQSTGDVETINLLYQKKISEKLLDDAAELKKELKQPSQKQLMELISDIEVILLQIANLETEYDLEGIDLIKSGVDRRGIFLKISIQEMQKTGPGSVPIKKQEVKRKNI